MLLRSRKRQSIPGRSAIRLALRLARFGQKVLLIEMGAGYRVLPAEASAERRGDVEVLASFARGALILARQRA